MEKLLKQRVEILAQEVDKMKSGAGEGYTKAEADAKFLSKDDASSDYQTKIADLAEIRSGAAAGLLVKDATEELVDESAKNLFNPEKVTTNPDRLVTDGNGYAFKSVSGDSRTSIYFVLNAWSDNTYVRQLNEANITSTGLFSCTFTKASDFNFLRFGHSGAVLDLQVTVDVSDLVNGETYVLSFNVTATDPSVLIAWNSTMFCTKAKWDVSHNFEPYVLPNYDLTRLESEDRAALAEVVDEGAKNLWDFASATVSGGGGADRVTYTKSDNSIAITAVSSWAFVAFDVQLKAGTYYFQGLVSSITGSDSKAVIIRINGYDGTVIKRIEITANGIIDGDFVVDTDRTITVSFYASEGEFTNSSYTISDLMICTEADWNVSQAYQPYRPSYQELYEMVLALQTTRTATTRKTTKTKTNEE